MAFAMKGGGEVWRAIKVFWKKKTMRNHVLTAKTHFAHSLSFILYIYIYIVVEVTMNIAKYSSRQSQQPKNVNF